MKNKKKYDEPKHGHLKATDYMIGVWWFPLGDKGDMMGNVIKGEGDEWRLIVRGRRYVDDAVFDSKDEKAFREYKIHGSEQRVFEAAEKALTQLAISRGSIVDYFDVRGDAQVFAEKAKQCCPSWLHVKLEVKPTT